MCFDERICVCVVFVSVCVCVCVCVYIMEFWGLFPCASVRAIGTNTGRERESCAAYSLSFSLSSMPSLSVSPPLCLTPLWLFLFLMSPPPLPSQLLAPQLSIRHLKLWPSFTNVFNNLLWTNQREHCSACPVLPC